MNMTESAYEGGAARPPVAAHRAPDPAPVDQPMPEPPPHQNLPHPVPQDDPVPDHNPSLVCQYSVYRLH